MFWWWDHGIWNHFRKAHFSENKQSDAQLLSSKTTTKITWI